MKKTWLILLALSPLLISCSGDKTAQTAPEYIKDTHAFDILMGQFAHNIENIWGLNEVLLAGPKDYVKYTDDYLTRSHINFDAGKITFETIATDDPVANLKRAIVSTLLMGDNPGDIDLYSTTNDVLISKEPFLYGQVVDNEGQPIRWEWRAVRFAEYLLQHRLQKRVSGGHTIWTVIVRLVPNHLDKRAQKFLPYVQQAAARYGVDQRLILSIMQVESSFNPYAVSNSDAIGLMQIVQHTAGLDVFRMKGKWGKPSRRYLFDPQNNIDTGAAYLSLLQNTYLGGITDPLSRRYAVICAYNGGAGSVLRVFSRDKARAVEIINSMSAAAVYQALTTKHPSAESRRYLYKVNSLMKAH